MADQWYFAQAGVEFGPYSPARMMELAAAGTLQRSAAVWKDGMTRRVAASKVDKLFAYPQTPSLKADALAVRSAPPAACVAGSLDPTTPAVTVPAPAATRPADSLPVVTEAPGVRAGGAAVASPNRLAARIEPVKKKRVMGVKGAVVTSQDGLTVSFKKKCLKCGHEDAGRSTMPIRNGPMRAHFFCPKCRKAQPVEMQGVPA